MLSDQNLTRFFCLVRIFWHYYTNNWKVFSHFKIFWNSLFQLLYLKGYKWLVSRKQWVRNDFLGYRDGQGYQTLKDIKVKGRQCSHYHRWIVVKISPLLLACFVNFMEKEPSTKIWGRLIIFHKVMNLQSFESNLSDIIPNIKIFLLSLLSLTCELLTF